MKTQKITPPLILLLLLLISSFSFGPGNFQIAQHDEMSPKKHPVNVSIDQDEDVQKVDTDLSYFDKMEFDVKLDSIMKHFNEAEFDLKLDSMMKHFDGMKLQIKVDSMLEHFDGMKLQMKVDSIMKAIDIEKILQKHEIKFMELDEDLRALDSLHSDSKNIIILKRNGKTDVWASKGGASINIDGDNNFKEPGDSMHIVIRQILDNGKTTKEVIVNNGTHHILTLPYKKNDLKSDPFANDPNDESIIKYDRKDIGKGRERIVIVRQKNVPEEEIELEVNVIEESESK